MDNERALARKLVNYSIDLKKDEKVLIVFNDVSKNFLKCLAEEIIFKGAAPIFQLADIDVNKSIILNATPKILNAAAKVASCVMNEVNAVIIVFGEENIFENSDIPSKKMVTYNKEYSNIVTKIRLTKKWVLLRYPTKAFAQNARMSTDAFVNYYFKVCLLDYSKMHKAMLPLKQLMQKTDRVRIVAKDTDLTFSIKGIPATICSGENNIPDGEIYTAPVKNSVNGKISFNISAPKDGVVHSNIVLEFKDGKVIKATSSHTKELNNVLNADEGSRYVGEFAFGVNPYVTSPISDILFDEKMSGSIHLALGNSYDTSDNGNKSSLHWDLIQSHDISYGGGEIYFNDVLIRKNGKFILSELVALNRENLVK